MWKDSVNSVLRSTTGYELRRPVDATPGATADTARERKAQAARLRAVRRRARALRQANQRLRERVEAAEQTARLSHRGISMPADQAERALAELRPIPSERLSLTDIANLEGTDKGTIGPSEEWPAHNYTDVYGAYLAPWRDRSITILEIGLGVPGDAWEAQIAHGRNEQGGGSLRAWYGYFPHARIYGVDINPATHLDNDRISTHVVDQGDPAAIAAFLASIGEVEFDLVVDDGSHRPDHQQITLGCLLPRVRAGGLYLIEDLLSNGRGDGGRGRRSYSADVLNTRRVLDRFRLHGAFAEPHAIVDPDYCAAHIAEITFHVPRRAAPHTEAVCAIRKSAGPGQ
ncbi:class I SAM-dependent methyltransferase [Nocardioides sambongensis]|uniref:class I SAM-dependent methyltransferase n=1 Tax=Nocardioides sambongensis TaxID=2589074 RepID=UPI00112760B8|nr:class I SAM-dependent methyltransferase [Nocardioides sambongensis]